jgi:MinD-like ATPase involved in chromosome partitioning or flagellar assembly
VGPVHFTDGFDRPDTIALGLDAPRLIAVVVGALCGYAVMQAPLPMAVRVCIAVLVAAVSAVLGWARYAGRPVLTWAWLGLRYMLSPQSGGGTPVGVAPVAAAVAEPEPPAIVEPVAAEGSPPADPGVPVWAQWLQYETARPSDADGCASDSRIVETSREAPLVVVMDEAAQQAQPESPTDVPPRPDRSESQPSASSNCGEIEKPPRASVLPYPTGDDVELAGDGLSPSPSAEHREAPPRAEVLRLPTVRADAAAAQPVVHITPHDVPPPVFVGAPRRITFFALNGGAGRTTLATEVACILAARGRHLAADGTVRPLNVALLDLDLRSASISVRLGIPYPTLADYLMRGAEPAHLDACMVRHASGVHALLGLPKPLASGAGALEPARVAEIVHRLERDGAHFVVIDVAADLDAVTTWVLSAVHDIFVVLTPTAGGVQDAYRTTAALRRLGLGHKLRYVVNRARGDVDLGEVMGDLGGRIAAVIPIDPAIEEAENSHRIAALDHHTAAAAALHDLAAHLYPSLSPAATRSRMSWLPWRRRAG